MNKLKEKIIFIMMNTIIQLSDIRKNIKRSRLEQNLTQQELADMAEMSRKYICDIENKS